MSHLKLFFIIQIAITAIGSIVLLEGRNPESAASFAIGSGIILLNVLSLAFVFSRVIQKKLIALSISIIVFKYAILGIIIYKLLSLAWVDRIWLCVGLASLVVSALFFASVAKTDDEDEEQT
ncbi:MAG: hypothetical protein ACXWC9_03295 [Pseudobdellovibrionaceae bacterium]